jgi:hypothetical protein
VLARHRVDYIVIGGIGVRLWGSPRLTEDVDICPATERANLERLASALQEMDAKFQPLDMEEGAPTPPWDARAFGPHLGASLPTTTRFGWLDLWFRPTGTDGYPDLIKGAATVEVQDLAVRLASLDDIIRSKAASGRDKDLEAMRHLQELRREIEMRAAHGPSLDD